MKLQSALAAALITVAFFAVACTQKSSDSAPTGAQPAVTIPVGPVPGPGKAVNLPKNPYEGNEVALREGRQLFVWMNCSGCHGGHGGGGMGPSLRDPVWIYGSADARIFDSIAHGRAHGMPAWGVKLPEDQIWKLVTYIKSMRTPNEPDPPIVTPEPTVK